MKIVKYPKRKDWDRILKRPAIDNKNLEKLIVPILEEVKYDGDKALKKYTLQFDKVALKNLIVSSTEIKNAEKSISKDLKEAILIAFKNIEKFHLSQKEDYSEIETMKGVTCWRRSVPIEKVGLYIPGGTAPLFSSILMLGIPANIAGCKEIILCSPPDKGGNIHHAILYTANLLGIKKIFKVGGAQAIAAMAFGTESIPQVFKIFGPGNQYVTVAKQLVNKEGIAIDMPAGPSELAVIADSTCNPEFVAADLISQTEHGVDSHVVLVSDNHKVITQVQNEIKIQLLKVSRKQYASASLEKSLSILVKSIDEAFDLINQYAPEHLTLQIADAKNWALKIKNAGSVFIGNYTPVAAGDYCSGTNHTLPTNGHAKTYSGVALDSFIKKITFQEITQEGIKSLGPTIQMMAEAEGLNSHSNSVKLRMLPD